MTDMTRGAVLKIEVRKRTQETSHFQQYFKLIFKSVFNEVCTFITPHMKTWKKCANSFPTRFHSTTPWVWPISFNFRMQRKTWRQTMHFIIACVPPELPLTFTLEWIFKKVPEVLFHLFKEMCICHQVNTGRPVTENATILSVPQSCAAAFRSLVRWTFSVTEFAGNLLKARI